MYEFWCESSGRFSRLQKSSVRGTEQLPRLPAKKSREKSVSLKTPCLKTGTAQEESWLWQGEWGGNSASYQGACVACVTYPVLLLSESLSCSFYRAIQSLSDIGPDTSLQGADLAHLPTVTVQC